MKILIVEDDELQCEILKNALSASRYVVDIAADGLTAWDQIQMVEYDLIVMDVMLPQIDGVSLCRRIRSKGSQELILLLTAKGDRDDKVIGLDAGADDYLVKPIDTTELSARIRALLRRKGAVLTSVLTWGDLRLDLNGYEVTYKNKALALTAKEYALLELFARNPQRVYSQSSILNQLWSLEDKLPGEETVRAHIKRLRQKLKSIDACEIIETVYGLGYRLNPAFEHPTEADSNQITENNIVTTEIKQSSTLETKYLKQQLLDRVNHLEQTIETALSNITQSDTQTKLQQEAQRESHKLIGALGMVKLMSAAESARLLEQALKKGTLPTVQDVRPYLTIVRQAVETLDVENTSTPSKPIEELQAKILIVDDDRFTLKLLEKLLAPWGLEIHTLDRPLDIWKTLDDVSPDLLVLDLQMPDLSGIDICQALRNDDRWAWLPILFLSGDRDSETVQQMFTVGADDYVTKPVVAPELITRIFNRLQRTRLLRGTR